MKCDLNLATRTYINQHLVNRVLSVGILVLLVWLAWNVKTLISNLQHHSRLRDDISGYEGRLATNNKGVSEQEYKRLQADIRFYNGIIARKTFDWFGLLESLENATPDNIMLSSFSRDPKNGEIKLEGRTVNFAGIAKYLERLESSGSFKDIMLLSHKDITIKEREKGVLFVISLRAVRP